MGKGRVNCIFPRQVVSLLVEEGLLVHFRRSLFQSRKGGRDGRILFFSVGIFFGVLLKLSFLEARIRDLRGCGAGGEGNVLERFLARLFSGEEKINGAERKHNNFPFLSQQSRLTLFYRNIITCAACASTPTPRPGSVFVRTCAGRAGTAAPRGLRTGTGEVLWMGVAVWSPAASGRGPPERSPGPSGCA